MKQFLKTIIIFSVIFFIIDKSAYFILKRTSALQSDKKLELIMNGSLEKELLILGSSRGIGGIDTELIEKETGLTSYNISYRGSDLVFQDFILETYLKYNTKPDKLLLVIDNPYLFMQHTNLGFRYDRLYALASHNYINDKLIELNKHSVASNFFYFSRLHGNQLRFTKVKTSNNWLIDDYGSQIVHGRSKDFQNMSFQESTGYLNIEENGPKLKAFENIKRSCLENNIELHLIFPPNFSSFNKEFYNRFKTSIPSDLPVYIYDQSNQNYLNPNNFYDPAHLNNKGARYFTKELATYLKNK